MRSEDSTEKVSENTIEEMFERFGPNYRYYVTFAGMLGVMAMVLSVTIVNVAVPSVMGAYGIGQDKAQWMATAFIATMTVSQLLNTWMVEAFGQRLAYIIIICVFLFGTAICAVSPNFDFIIVGRILQGFSAGVSQPLVMVTLFQVFPANRRAFAMGLYGMTIMLAPGLGPVVGGIAIDAFSWRHIFYIPVPLCLLAMALGAIFMPGGLRVRKLPKFDWTGLILLCTALVFLLTTLANGQQYGWVSNELFTRFGIGVTAAVAFVWFQARSEKPLFEVRLLRIPAFAAAASVAFVFGFGNMASSYAIPVFVQTVQGYSATEAGLALVPAGLLLIVLFPISGRIADNVPAYIPIMLGLMFFAVGAILMSDADINTAFWSIAIFTMIGRFGMALIMPPLVSSALKTLPPEDLNKGSGALNFIRQLGGSCGINLLVIWMEQRTQLYNDVLTATQTPANSASAEWIGRVENLLNEGGVPEALHNSGALHYLGSVVEAQAGTLGFQDGFLFIAAVFICALIPTWVLKRARRTSDV
ncbi:MAG: EmrB/QacA subfamily drug resistance transporter [Alphaproteobacteria bacterium]|jgi:DHA2 family multidrug resistance protein